MHFTTFTTLASIAALAGSALAVPPPPAGETVYTINALAESLPKANFLANFTAAHSKLWLNNTNQNADCEGISEVAFFNFNEKEGSVYLYDNPHIRPVQQVIVTPGENDSHLVSYVTRPVSKPPAGVDFEGWSIDVHGNLVWRETPFMACPNNADGSWSIYLSKNGNPGCVLFSAETTAAQYPNECYYTQ